MKEELYFFWNFSGRGGAKAAMAMLRRCDLRHVAKQAVDVELDDPDAEPDDRWTTGSTGCVRLAKDDPRVAMLKEELRKAGIERAPFLYRTYTKRELENLPWQLVTGSSTMVVAGSLQGQVWDVKRACAACGAGAVPVPPLIVRADRMPKQGWIVSVPAGVVVVSKELGATLVDAGLTGFALEPVRLPSRSSPDGRYWWLRITSWWPAPSARPTCRVGNPCGMRPPGTSDAHG